MSDRAFVYAAIIVGTLAISLDFASVDLALPALEAQYGLDLASVQWVINGSVLAFAVLMVAGGRLADGYGKERFPRRHGHLCARVALRRHGLERRLGNRLPGLAFQAVMSMENTLRGLTTPDRKSVV